MPFLFTSFLVVGYHKSITTTILKKCFTKYWSQWDLAHILARFNGTLVYLITQLEWVKNYT